MIEVELWNLTTIRIYWKASIVMWVAVIVIPTVMMHILPWTL